MSANRISYYTLPELIFEIVFGIVALTILLAIIGVLAVIGFGITCIVHYWPQIQALW